MFRVGRIFFLGIGEYPINNLTDDFRRNYRRVRKRIAFTGRPGRVVDRKVLGTRKIGLRLVTDVHMREAWVMDCGVGWC